MSLHKSPRLLVALPLIVVGAYGAIGAAPPATGGLACSVMADTVRSGQASITVNVRYTEEIGDSLSVTVPAGSKLGVSSVRKGVTPLTADMLVNSEQGVAGDWDLTLNGNKGTCTGTITVSAPKKK